MPTPLRVILMTAAITLTGAGCSSFTDPDIVTDFQYTEVEDPATIVAGIEATAAFGELFILGHVPTPTRCYKLGFDFQKGGQKLTVRVQANPSGTSNCDQSQGGYRYTLAVYNLKAATYQITAIHEVSGGQGGQFTSTVTVR